jgi:hypothetical protein
VTGHGLPVAANTQASSPSGYRKLAHGLLHLLEGVEKRLEKEPLMIQKL